MDPEMRKAELNELCSFHFLDTEAKERDQEPVEIDPVQYARMASDGDIQKLLSVLLVEKQESFLSFCERHVLQLKPILLTLLRTSDSKRGMIQIGLDLATSMFYSCQFTTRKYILLQKYLPEVKFPSYADVRAHALKFIPTVTGFTSKTSKRQGARISLIESIQKQLEFKEIMDFYQKHQILPIKIGGDARLTKKLETLFSKP
jgi:hypothetical protein